MHALLHSSLTVTKTDKSNQTHSSLSEHVCWQPLPPKYFTDLWQRQQIRFARLQGGKKTRALGMSELNKGKSNMKTTLEISRKKNRHLIYLLITSCPCFFAYIRSTFSKLLEMTLVWSCQMLSNKPQPHSAVCRDRAEISPRLPWCSLRKPLILFFISVAKLQDPGICSFSSYIPFSEARINALELAVHCQLKPLKWTQKSQPSLNREM